jgi:RNA polymerase sigma-70 factor (ECF subfamily)
MTTAAACLSEPLSQPQAATRLSWRALYEDHFDAVYRLVCRFGIYSDAEDVVQEVFIRAHKKIEDGEEVLNPRGWLRGIAVRVLAEQRRWRAIRSVKKWFVQTIFELEQPESPTPEQTATHSETQREVAAVLRQMSPKLRDALVLTDIDECSTEEAAALLGIPENTVRSRRRLAREQFGRLWKERETT